MSPVFSDYIKAVERLKEALAQDKNEFIRDSVIRRFEFSIEIAWKSAQKAMGTKTSAPKDVIREMAQSSYIEDVEFWLRAVDMRSLSSHTYREDLAEQVYNFVDEFFPELEKLVKKLEGK